MVWYVCRSFLWLGVKRVIKAEPDVKTVTGEASFVVARATVI